MPKTPKNVPPHLGKQLAQYRKAAGVTQVELAQAIGMSQRMVSYYEGTEDHPLAKLLRHFATHLDVSADQLLGVEASSEDPKLQAKKR